MCVCVCVCVWAHVHMHTHVHVRGLLASITFNGKEQQKYRESDMERNITPK